MKRIYKSRDKLLRRILNTHRGRLVPFIVGLMSLALLVCVEVALMSIIWHGDIPLPVVGLGSMSIAISAPFISWLARVINSRFLLPENSSSNRLAHKPSLVYEPRKEL